MAGQPQPWNLPPRRERCDNTFAMRVASDIVGLFLRHTMFSAVLDGGGGMKRYPERSLVLQPALPLDFACPSPDKQAPIER